MPDEPPARAPRRYGILTALLAVVAVAALVAVVVIAVGHRDVLAERRAQSAALSAAADWTGVLINMTADTLQASLRTLHDGTVGPLNADFDAALGPFVAVVAKLAPTTRGDVDSVSIDLGHPVTPGPELAVTAARTDTVLVLATSQSSTAGAPAPRLVHWNLRLGVSRVGDRLLVSSLENLR